MNYGSESSKSENFLPIVVFKQIRGYPDDDYSLKTLHLGKKLTKKLRKSSFGEIPVTICKI